MAAAFVLVFAVSGCAEPVRNVFTEFGAGPPPDKAPDFVAQSRPAQLDYVPVGRTNAQAQPAARSAEEIKKLEAEMEAARTRNESQGSAARRAATAPAPAPRRP